MPDNESLGIKNLVLVDWDGIDRLLKCGQEDEITDN